MNQSKPVNNMKMEIIYVIATKQDNQQPFGERTGRKLACLPLSYIKIPLFWSMMKGNLQKNIAVAIIYKKIRTTLSYFTWIKYVVKWKYARQM